MSSYELQKMFVVLFSGFLPLDQSLLVMPKLRSDLADSRKFVVFRWIAPLGPIFLGGADITVRLLRFTEICCFCLRALLQPSYRLYYLLPPLLSYYDESNTNIPESLQDY